VADEFPAPKDPIQIFTYGTYQHVETALGDVTGPSTGPSTGLSTGLSNWPAR
jgi:hypothetical protein